MAAATAGPSPAEGRQGGPRRGRFRFAAVFLLTLSLCVFLILAPESDWAHAVAIGLQCGSLMVIIATSRTTPAVRRHRTIAGAVVTCTALIAVASGQVADWIVFLFAAALSVSIPAALAGGLVRLIRTQGVTIQAVAGALTIYAMLGVIFAWVIGLVAHFQSAPFFSNGDDGTTGERVYFSFTALTTTGFGDLAAGTQAGRAVVLLEMLSGQIYLVTVIGVLVGSFGARAARSAAD
jgi:hypothetical protein